MKSLTHYVLETKKISSIDDYILETKKISSIDDYIQEGLRINKSNIKDININNCTEDLINHFLLDVFLKDNFINKSEYDEACEKIDKYVNDNNIKNITFYSSVKKDYLSYIPNNIIGDLIMNSNGSPDDYFIRAIKDLFVNGSILFVNDESYIKSNKKIRIKIQINPKTKYIGILFFDTYSTNITIIAKY